MILTGSYVIHSLTGSYAISASSAETASYALLAQSIVDSGSLTVASASHAAEIQWTGITNRPTASVSKIDEAAAKVHNHSNKDVLDNISQESVTSWNSKWTWNEEQVKEVKVHSASYADNVESLSSSFASWISSTSSVFSGTASFTQNADTLGGTKKSELLTDVRITGEGNGDLSYWTVVGGTKLSGSVSLAHNHSLLTGDSCSLFIENGQVVIEMDV